MKFASNCQLAEGSGHVLHPARIFFNIVKNDTFTAKAMQDLLLSKDSVWKDAIFNTAIPKCEYAVQGETYSKPFTATHPRCSGGLAYNKLVKEMVKYIG